MGRKAYYTVRMYYNEDFKDKIEEFQENIKVDPRLDKKIDPNKKLSFAFRRLVLDYNIKFRKFLLSKNDTKV